MMRASILGMACLLAACFEPDYPTGISCSSAGTCPPGQACDFFDNRCVSAGTIQVDAPPLQVDADETSACVLSAQTGCPPGFKCIYAGSATPNRGACRPDGSIAGGGMCTVDTQGDDLCVAGLQCIFNECIPFCGFGLSCAATYACIDFTQYQLCLRQCDALTQDCPVSAGMLAQACFIGQGTTACAVPERFLAEGAACTAFNDCRQGLSCVEGVCRAHCDYGSTPDMQGTCAAGQLCVFAVGSYGVCQ
jgi:hypothetical protein